VKYKSFLRPDDKPAIWLNQKTMAQYRPKMKALYYDPSKYDTYLEQLGIKYPTSERNTRAKPPAPEQRSPQGLF
jgi:aminobenzoyl-glutamate utilization protein B